MALNDHFDHVNHDNHGYQWQLHEAVLDNGDVQPVAESLAEAFIRDWCPDRLVTAWENRREGGPPHDQNIQAKLEAFIEPSFGLPPAEDGDPNDHVQGAVAEHLWYYLQRESDEGHLHLEPPDLHPTSGGGDSIAVYRSQNELSFRLWEIKKTTSSLNSTVSRAFGQLESRGARYLAEMTVIGQENPDPEVATLLSNLPVLWIDNSPEASVGVSVAIPCQLIDDDCFTSFPEHFPGLGERSPLLGLLKAVGDYTSFVRAVQEELWTRIPR
jgi:hypothetical protein